MEGRPPDWDLQPKDPPTCGTTQGESGVGMPTSSPQSFLPPFLLPFLPLISCQGTLLAEPVMVSLGDTRQGRGVDLGTREDVLSAHSSTQWVHFHPGVALWPDVAMSPVCLLYGAKAEESPRAQLALFCPVHHPSVRHAP